MARSTQFIGLTDGCRKQIEGLTNIPARGWETFGMFEEDIPLGIYYREDGSLAAIEYVIACPWSSGPMIFTGLLFPNGPSEFNWIEDSQVQGQEFDSTKGMYYV